MNNRRQLSKCRSSVLRFTHFNAYSCYNPRRYLSWSLFYLCTRSSRCNNVQISSNPTFITIGHMCIFFIRTFRSENPCTWSCDALLRLPADAKQGSTRIVFPVLIITVYYFWYNLVGWYKLLLPGGQKTRQITRNL